MTIILILFLLLFLKGARTAPKGEFFEDYLSLEKSNAIKGIFVMFVFFRHYAQYVTLDSSWDRLFNLVNGCLGQMIVVAFLFYSGYGVLVSIQKKGMEYVKTIPVQRAFKVWCHYAIVVCLFLLANISIGNGISLRRFVLTLVCWSAMGNSTWYILAIVVTYLLTYISFRCFPQKEKYAVVCLTVLTIGAVLVLQPVRPGRYYNTLLCYPLGAWWALYKDKIDGFLRKRSHYWICLVGAMVITVVANWLRNDNVWIYELAGLTFVGTGILITMKLQLDNPFIQYAGNHVFSLFILQRLPMLLLSKTTNLEERPYLFFVVTLAATFVLSYVFDVCVGKLDHVVFRRRAAV